MNLRNHPVNAACLYGAAVFLCKLFAIFLPGSPELDQVLALIRDTAAAYGVSASLIRKPISAETPVKPTGPAASESSNEKPPTNNPGTHV